MRWIVLLSVAALAGCAVESEAMSDLRHEQGLCSEGFDFACAKVPRLQLAVSNEQQQRSANLATNLALIQIGAETMQARPQSEFVPIYPPLSPPPMATQTTCFRQGGYVRCNTF
jgi:hypothetical protein